MKSQIGCVNALWNCSKDQTHSHLPTQNPILPVHKSPHCPLLTLNTIARYKSCVECDHGSRFSGQSAWSLTNPIGIPCFYWLMGFLIGFLRFLVYAGLSCCCSQWRFISAKIRVQGSQLYAHFLSINEIHYLSMLIKKLVIFFFFNGLGLFFLFFY